MIGRMSFPYCYLPVEFTSRLAREVSQLAQFLRLGGINAERLQKALGGRRRLGCALGHPSKRFDEHAWPWAQAGIGLLHSAELNQVQDGVRHSPSGVEYFLDARLQLLQRFYFGGKLRNGELRS